MKTVFQNLRFAVRLLRKGPGFTAVAVITLALGIGANTAIFSVVHATLLVPMPYPNPDQLVVWSRLQGSRNVIAAADFLGWKRQSKSFQDLNAWTGRTFNLATADRPEQIEGQVTTPGFYKMMGVEFILGRDFLPEEGQPGNNHVVILANRLWGERFGELCTTSARSTSPPFVRFPSRCWQQPYWLVTSPHAVRPRSTPWWR